MGSRTRDDLKTSQLRGTSLGIGLFMTSYLYGLRNGETSHKICPNSRSTDVVIEQIRVRSNQKKITKRREETS